MNVSFEKLGLIPYKDAWEYQENLLAKNLAIKKANRDRELNQVLGNQEETESYLLFCEHPPVFTLGKSGLEEHLLVNNQFLKQKGIEYYKTNRGGDITFHGPEQLVAYPIFDLERIKPDIVLYMRNLEEVIIQTMMTFGIKTERSQGETGVWIDTDIPHRARKICAMGVPHQPLDDNAWICSKYQHRFELF
ncbi:MAG: lipoyl(octanoyl) transferase LipB [Chitinophagaceae bacterium]